MERQFTSGSRQAPDPFDQFLEEHNFYRKHTARDASCLFRVISEQMYDTQLHHLAIREKCVTYMRKHRKHFDYHVDRDFDEYLDDMSKPKTYGTLLELRAASYMFERNVFLFQPFNLGNYFNEYRSNFVEVFRVFYTPERHFDSVFTADYIQEAAICQSICYEILYRDLFKLPDVSFAVEQMLHGPTFENIDYRTETNEDGYSTRFHLGDGRSFELDLPHNTNCILENYKLCHFHYTNFPRYSDDLQRELKATSCEEYDKNSLIIQRTAESFLPNKYVSCVRQLLQEGITPFPYKVAKALDANMYRNIEFDSWNEMRKELRLQNWYNGDANFKVGAKCHVKLRKSEQDLYTCHIQEIAVDKGQCIVFVEQLGEKRLVPYENLTPLPPDQFKPWTVPYRLQRHMQKCSSVRFTRHYNYRLKFNTTEHHQQREFACGSTIDTDSYSNNYMDDDPKKVARQQQNQHAAASYFKLKQYTHLEDFRAHVEYCTMPVTVTHSNREVEVSKSGSNLSREIDSNENSRTPSRSPTSVGIQCNNNLEGAQNKVSANNGLNSNGEEQLGSSQTFVAPHIDGYDANHYNHNGAFYMPEVQSFYPMYPYSSSGPMAEDYYGYCGFDGVLPPGAALVPSVNNVNGIYYLCNNTLPPPANYINAHNPYFIPPPPQAISLPQQSPNPYYAPPSLAIGPNGTQATQNVATLPPPNLQLPVHNTPSRLPHRSGRNTPTNTPVTGRINYDAKKSLKANGVDLPNDVATLRYFYNIGLDYYHKQKSNSNAEVNNNDYDKLSNDLTNVKLDENANQTPSTKTDSNNFSAMSNEFSHPNDAINLPSNQTNKHSNYTNLNPSNSGGGGNRNNNNNQRRYNSRYYNGRDRQMPQRNNSNQNLQGTGQQQYNYNHHLQNNHQGYNNDNTKYSNNNNYKTANTQNITRNTQQQTNQQHLSQQQFISHSSVTVESARQVSPNREPQIRINSAEIRNCNTPTTTNNSNNGVAYSSNPDQMNEGGTSSQAGITGQLSVPMPSTAGGVYIPIPLPAGPPPPQPPYSVFATHQTASAPHQTPGVGMQPGYVTGPPPPQIIAHCSLPLPQQLATINSSPGSDNVESVCNSEITTNNGAVITMPPSGVPIQCPNYPPPMPFFYSPNGVNSLGGGGGAGGGGGGMSGPLSASTNGIHLVTPFSHQVAPSTPTNQTPFASPHASMGTQGYYCLQPPPIIHSQQQVTTHLVQQTTPVNANRTSVSNNSSQDVNNGPCSDVTQQNND